MSSALISLGIGSPAGIPPFLLFGLSPEGDGDVNGSAALTLGALTLAAEGEVTGAGSASGYLISLGIGSPAAIPQFLLVGLSPDTSGTNSGSAAITLGALVLTAEGQILVQGEADVTLGALIAAGEGTVPVLGQSGVVLGALTLQADGSVVFTDVAGQAAITFGTLTTTADGAVLVQGAADITLGALTLSAGQDFVRSALLSGFRLRPRAVFSDVEFH